MFLLCKLSFIPQNSHIKDARSLKSTPASLSFHYLHRGLSHVGFTYQSSQATSPGGVLPPPPHRQAKAPPAALTPQASSLPLEKLACLLRGKAEPHPEAGLLRDSWSSLSPDTVTDGDDSFFPCSQLPSSPGFWEQEISTSQRLVEILI